MQDKLLESAEFYHRRYRNFSTLIIFPVMIFVIAAIFFAGFATKETAIKSRGEIRPTEVISKIYSTNSTRILTNKLEQNHIVEEGEILLTYQGNEADIEMKHLKEQISEAQNQLKENEKFIGAVKSRGSADFGKKSYGYNQKLEDYQSQITQLEQAAVIDENQRQKQNDHISEMQSAVENEINEVVVKKAEYEELKRAIKQAIPLSEQHSLYSTYAVYENQLEEAGRADAVMEQIVLEIDTQVEQIETELSSLKIQQSNTESMSNVDNSISLKAEKDALSAQYLLQAEQDHNQLITTISELESAISLQESQLANQSIVASDSGILHLNNEVKGSQVIPQGTLIGEIYPNLSENNKVHVEMYLFSQDVSSVQLGDTMRLQLPKDGLVNGIELNGKIIIIDHAASRTEQGNVYKVTAEVELDDNDQEVLRYGLEGEVSMVTGETTYFNYYIDKLLNN